MECNIRNVFHVLLFVLYVFSVKSDTTTVRFIPRHYKLEIFTESKHFEELGSTEELTYTGIVTIDFSKEGVLPDNKEFNIILNASQKTKITKCKLVNSEKPDQPITGAKFEVQNGKLVIKVPEGYTGVENFRLTLNFVNPFGNDMTGFYRSSYKEKDETEKMKEKTRWLLTTHFEPIYARNAFPCFDQPNLKAKFQIEITVPKDINTVLSNAPLNGEPTAVNDNLMKYSFKVTEAPMSTYLVAFTASNLKGTEEITFEGQKKLKTFGRKELIDAGDAKIAQDTAHKALLKLNDYLKEKYSFEKIDQIGIPDFSAGAMENWGHISFREKALFFNENSPQTVKQANVLTIIHELVHQWFGNLVTLESWDYIWLNEAFANYLEYVIGAQIKEKWELMKQVLVNEVHLRAFETDGLKSSTPLNYKIPNESLIVSSFNDIPYAKGAAVLRMWHYQLGDSFKEALQKYIKTWKGKNTKPENLAEVFKNTGNLTEEVFKSWTDQAGYPVVELIKLNATHYNITQNRFLWENETDTTVYTVPISFSTDKDSNFNPNVKSLLKGEKVTIKKDWKWVVINNLQAGYYRVNYDEENWMALSDALMAKNYSNIPEENRAQIVNDIFSLARSLQKNYVDYSTAFKLSKYLTKETSYIAWKTALNAFDFLRIKLHKESVYSKFQEHVISLAQSHYKGLAPKDGLSEIEILKNVEISRLLCSLGFKTCVTDAQKLYTEKKENVNMDEIILCTVIANNSSKVWEEVFKKYSEEKDSALKLMYISALGCSSNQTLISGFLNKTLEKNSGIRKQDFKYVLSSAYNGNMLNVETAFKFIEANFKEIATQYGGLDPLGGALVGIAKKLKSKEQVKRLEELVSKITNSNEGAASKNNAENAVRIAKSNTKWVENRMKQINRYLNSGSLLSYSFALLLLCLISVFQF